MRRILILVLLGCLALPSRADRIKDIVSFSGDREWVLLGTGLVTGLAGTGDGNGFTASSAALANVLERLGNSVSPREIRSKNVALVTITARLSSLDRTGSELDITLSSAGDAASLEGGVLVPTLLAEVTTGTVFAQASGSVSIGGFNVSAGANNRVHKNHTTVGRIPNGAMVLADPPRSPRSDRIGLRLNHPDRNTASGIARCINKYYPDTALAEDAGYVSVSLPESFAGDLVGFEAAIGKINTRVDRTARVVVNERTGTIVVGAGVTLGEAAVAHGGLTVEIRTRYNVSQPNPFNESGQTVVTPAVDAYVNESEASVIRVPVSTTVRDVADILNSMGATPRDIIAILQALKQSGSLQAELVTL